MDAAAGNIFFYEWETAFMEWFQNSIPQGSFLSAILNNLSLFGEQMLMIAVMGFFYWCWDKETGKKVALIIIFSNVFCMRISVLLSIEDVASSRISMGGRLRITLVMHKSCF